MDSFTRKGDSDTLSAKHCTCSVSHGLGHPSTQCTKHQDYALPIHLAWSWNAGVEGRVKWAFLVSANLYQETKRIRINHSWDKERVGVKVKAAHEVLYFNTYKTNFIGLWPRKYKANGQRIFKIWLLPFSEIFQETRYKLNFKNMSFLEGKQEGPWEPITQQYPQKAGFEDSLGAKPLHQGCPLL